MDNFMMQLTDKINAQEMIRANTSAEVEELGRVKEQIEALRAVVDQTREMVDRLSEVSERNAELMRENANGVSQDADRPKLDEDVLYIIEEEVSQLAKELEGIRNSVQLEKDKEDKKDEKENDLQSSADSNTGLNAEVATGLSRISESLEETKGRLAALEGLMSEVAGQTAKSVQAVLEQNEQKESDVNAQEEVAGRIQEALGQLREEYATQREGQSQIQDALGQLWEEYATQREGQSQIQDALGQLREEYATQREGQSQIQDALGQLREEYAAQREDQSQIQETLGQLREEYGVLSENQNQLRNEYGVQGERFSGLETELSRLDEHLTNVGANATARNAEHVETLKQFMQENFAKLQEVSGKEAESPEKDDEIKKLLEEFIARQEEKDAKLEDRLTKMHEGIKEGYHKECVKVYRNVQAAFGEENQRQTTALDEKLGKAAGNSKMALIFAVLAFCMGLASVALQVLQMF